MLTERRYQNVVHWNLTLKDINAAEEWHEKMLKVALTCVGKDSLMYREMEKDLFGSGRKTAGWETPAAVFAGIYFDGHDKVMK